MSNQIFKGILFGTSALIASGVTVLLLKNYYEQFRFKPLSKQKTIIILKRIRKQNYIIYKQIAIISKQMYTEFKSSTLSSITNYLESSSSPLKIQDMFQTNIKNVCQEENVNCSDFKLSINYYENDPQITILRKQSQKWYSQSMEGRIPEIKVTVPQFLTKSKVLQIQDKLVQKKYFANIKMFRQFRNHNQKELKQNQNILKNNISNSEQQEENILLENNIGTQDQPSSAIYRQAVYTYKLDHSFKMKFQKIEFNYKNIFNKYLSKMQTNSISNEQLDQLEEEILFFKNL